LDFLIEQEVVHCRRTRTGHLASFHHRQLGDSSVCQCSVCWKKQFFTTLGESDSCRIIL
jgi:hypothetical protein